MLDESRAIEQARRGEEDGWLHLYGAHADLVFRIAMRRVQDRDAALDVVQDTFMRAAGAIAGFRGEGSFRGWLARIAVNEAASEIRRRARRREVPLEAASAPTDERIDPLEAATRRDAAHRALDFARGLPEMQRQVLLLRVREGLTYAEIARVLGTTEGSARVSYHHAIHKLRDHLADAKRGKAEEVGGAG